MPISSSTVPVETASSLQHLAELAANPNKTEDDIAKLKKLGKSILDEVDKTISSLNVSAQLFLSDISTTIQKGIENPDDWNKLPSINSIRLSVSELNDISNIIKEKINTVAVDLFALMAELLKFQRDSNSIQADAKAIATKARLKLAENEKTEKVNAANSEFTASMISSIVQAAVGVAQGVMSVKSLIQSKSNFKESAKIVNDSYDLQKNSPTVNKDLNKQLDSDRKELARLDVKKTNLENSKTNNNKNNQVNSPNAKSGNIDERIKKVNNDDQNLKNKESKFEENHKYLEETLDARNNKVRAKTEQISAETQVMSSVASVINSAAGCVSSIYKRDSRIHEIEAEQISKQGGFMSEASQAYQEAIRNCQQMMNDLIQFLKNILNTIDTTMSNLNSKA